MPATKRKRNKSPEWQEAHFVITGEFITQHARDRIFEAGWEHSLRFLMENLCGIDYETAIDVLSGKKKLVGKNEVRPSDESAKNRKELEERVHSKYAGTVLINGLYWRPYAFVNNFGANQPPLPQGEGFATPSGDY